MSAEEIRIYLITQMKYLSTLLFFLIAFNLTPLKNASAQNFEGVIIYEIPELKDKIGTSRLEYMIKGNKIRIEYDSGNSRTTSILYETTEKTMFISIGMLGGHVEVPPDDVELNFRDYDPGFVQTGNSKQIEERVCEVWKAEIEDSRFRYCFQPETADFILPINSVTAESVPQWAGVNLPDNYLPLEVTKVADDGSEEIMMRAHSVEEKTLNRRLFSVFDN